MYHSLSVNVEDSTGSTELVIRTTKVHGSNTVLTECCCAHDARFDGNIEICFGKDCIRIVISK